jgi:hypothetical protein
LRKAYRSKGRKPTGILRRELVRQQLAIRDKQTSAPLGARTVHSRHVTKWAGPIKAAGVIMD